MGGIAPERDFAGAVRPVLFYTDIEEFQYATHGGTGFVVSYQGRPYALTCRHVFKDFDDGQLTLFGAQFPNKGDKPAKIMAVCYPSSPQASAVDSDVTDFCLIEFDTSVTTDFFGGNAYPLSERTIWSSATGDRLSIFGALKEKTIIDPPDITVGYCRLEASDVGPSSDPFLRQGAAQYLGHEFATVTGISGAPVFNLSHNRLCGIIVRGGLTAGRLSIHYAAALDILRFVEAAFERRPSVFYTRPPHV
jgi:Trypsin-like peptidase domain